MVKKEEKKLNGGKNKDRKKCGLRRKKKKGVE